MPPHKIVSVTPMKLEEVIYSDGQQDIQYIRYPYHDFLPVDLCWQFLDHEKRIIDVSGSLGDTLEAEYQAYMKEHSADAH